MSQHIEQDSPAATPPSWSQQHMPLVITLVYLVLGTSWIFFSDRAVEHYFPSFEEIARFQTYKGWFYILVSAGILYLLLRRYHRRNVKSLVLASEMTTALAASENEVRRINQELEGRVAQRTQQLAAANRELEAFVHAVSHDLRAPLRSMAGFSQALQDAAPTALDDRSKHYLRRIQEASQRMATLIDDLLELSRISQSQMLPKELDFTQLTREMATQVQERYPGREVTLIVQPGMTAHGDARLLRIAMENLLDNAWKYTAYNPAATVIVGCDTAGVEPQYSIRDNGVGFNMAYAGKLFGPFQRMHTESQFPGTGIGLVTVQRILARHGGRIWADAEVDKGAVFTFTLPPGPDDRDAPAARAEADP
jgi:signal transduction histidine kinase